MLLRGDKRRIPDNVLSVGLIQSEVRITSVKGRYIRGCFLSHFDDFIVETATYDLTEHL